MHKIGKPYIDQLGYLKWKKKTGKDGKKNTRE
jgi:hypothetical protein